eukprot:TRINITY_DN12176_c0_g1_i1.p1 TRINITY_DN12176_c0_g1~~TRINITY_DN12176_c0_g1_i1.p1  ORF type:complete len:282 (+),score=66.06 TRINITY_DN12176_c0_g1_i1:64-909(+)
MKVAGKICCVTGGGNGIGAALVEALCEKGAKAVLVADIDVKGCEKVVEAMKEKYPKTVCIAKRCDVTNEGHLRDLVLTSKMRFMRGIDLFAANAGITGGFGGPEVSNREWTDIWNINVMHIIMAARHCLPDMLAKGEGGFIITASAAGLLSQIGSLPYTVTKRAAVSIAEWLSITYGEQGISVSCLCPQAVDTNMIKGAPGGGGGVAGVDGVLQPLPVARETIETFESGRFLVLPHKSVDKYVKGKAQDTDKWIVGMRGLMKRSGGGLLLPGNHRRPQAKM